MTTMEVKVTGTNLSILAPTETIATWTRANSGKRSRCKELGLQTKLKSVSNVCNKFSDKVEIDMDPVNENSGVNYSLNPYEKLLLIHYGRIIISRKIYEKKQNINAIRRSQLSP